MMQKLAETLPRELQGIPLCCNPTPPLVKANLLTLHQIILVARRVPLEQVCLRLILHKFLAFYSMPFLFTSDLNNSRCCQREPRRQGRPCRGTCRAWRRVDKAPLPCTRPSCGRFWRRSWRPRKKIVQERTKTNVRRSWRLVRDSRDHLIFCTIDTKVFSFPSPPNVYF
jgi:hypothetical protein